MAKFADQIASSHPHDRGAGIFAVRQRPVADPKPCALIVSLVRALARQAAREAWAQAGHANPNTKETSA